MRRFLLAACAAAVASGAATAGTVPPGATARCVDGTYSFSQHHSGTCSHHGGVAAWLEASATPAAPAASAGVTILVRPRTRTARCTRGVLADRRCSPGAYYSRLTKAVICSPSYRTSSVRNVPQTEKYEVEREYGMASRLYGRSIEIDHIISLELGGSNAIANLFPEPGSGRRATTRRTGSRTGCTAWSAPARSVCRRRAAGSRRTGGCCTAASSAAPRSSCEASTSRSDRGGAAPRRRRRSRAGPRRSRR
jgi:hypothetical protein